MPATDTDTDGDGDAPGAADVDAELSASALAYPFGRAEDSFVLDAATARPASPEEILAAAADPDRVALLAYGSNGSPSRLRAKLAAFPGAWRIVVATARLPGFDIVYSAHVSPHGAISATPHPVPGTEVAVHMLLLTAAELRHVNVTEPNYVLGRLDRLAARVEGVGEVDSAHAYVSRHGALALDGEPIALAAVAAHGRGLDALDERALMARVRDRLDPGASLNAFVAAQIRDADLRAARTEALHEGAIAFESPSWAPLQKC